MAHYGLQNPSKPKRFIAAMIGGLQEGKGHQHRGPVYEFGGQELEFSSAKQHRGGCGVGRAECRRMKIYLRSPRSFMMPPTPPIRPT